jgi:hypothetical protein
MSVMDDVPVVLGITRTQDASACLIGLLRR